MEVTNEIIDTLRTIDPTITISTATALATCTGEHIGPTEVGKWITAKDRTGRFPLRFKTSRASPGLLVFQDNSDQPKYSVELQWGTTVGLRRNGLGKVEAVFPAAAIRNLTRVPDPTGVIA